MLSSIIILDMLYVINLQQLQELKNCCLAVVREIVLKNIVRVWEEKAGDSRRNVWVCNISSLWSIA